MLIFNPAKETQILCLMRNEGTDRYFTVKFTRSLDEETKLKTLRLNNNKLGEVGAIMLARYAMNAPHYLNLISNGTGSLIYDLILMLRSATIALANLDIIKRFLCINGNYTKQKIN